MRYVKEMMNTAIETASPNDNLNLAMKRMLVNGIHHLLIVEPERESEQEPTRLVGLLSVRDLDVLGTERDREGLLIKAAMITNMITVTSDTTISEAAKLMRNWTIGCLPVVEGNKPVGIITTNDMLAMIFTETHVGDISA